MIVITDLLQPYIDDTENISNEDLGALLRYVKGVDSKPSSMVKMVALALRKDDCALVKRFEEREAHRKEKNRDANARFRQRQKGNLAYNGDISGDSESDCPHTEVRDNQRSSVIVSHHHRASVMSHDGHLNQDHTKPIQTSPSQTVLSDGSTGVSKGGFGKSPFEQGCLSDKVDARTYTAFANKLFDPEEDDASAFSFWVKSFYEGSKTIIFAKWQDYVRKAIKTAREEGHFMPNDSPVDPE